MANKLLSQLLKGTYSGATAYTVGDIVNYNGSGYCCKVNSTGNLPTDTTYWALLASKGDTGATGNNGTNGTNGTNGAAATIAVGTTITTVPGGSATVTNSGSSSAATFNFEIPRGEVGVEWQGAYNGATAYVIGDAVSYEGSSYYCILASTGNLPTNTTYWSVLALKGTDGAGSGDFSTNTSTSVDSEIVLFSSTGGKTGKRSTGTGVAKLTSGVLSVGTVANSEMADMTTKTYKGRTAGTTGAPEDVAVATLKTDLALVKGDVGLGNVDNTSDSTKNSATATLTNKRVQPRTASSTTASNLSPDLSTANVYYRTTQTATLTIDAPTGTPVIGETIMIYVDSAGAQTLTINGTYKPFGAAFPATTTAGKTFMMSAQFNGTDWKTLWAVAQ